MVVGLHAGFLVDITSTGHHLTGNGIFRIAVPVFLIISGFYFYPIITEEKSVFWFKRVLYLYLFWMLFYSYFWFRPSDVSLFDLFYLALTFVIGYKHLWFLPGMMGAALLVILIKNMSSVNIVMIILVAFMTGVIIQYAGHYQLFDNTQVGNWFDFNWLHRNFLFLAFPFFCIGFLIHKHNIQKLISLKQSMLFSGIGFFLLIVESYANFVVSTNAGDFDNFLSLLLVCPALFLLIMNFDFQGKSKELALYATGIYFVHGVFLHFFRNVSAIDGTLLTFVVILSSTLATFVLIKINRQMKFIL